MAQTQEHGALTSATDEFSAGETCAVFVRATEQLPLVAFAKDAAGRYVYVNDHYVQSVLNPTYGRRPAMAFLGRRNRDLGSLPERFAWVERQERKVLTSSLPILYDEYYPRQDRPFGHAIGVRFPLVSSGRVYLAGVFVDVTETELADEAAARSEWRFRSLFEGAGVANLTLAEGRVVDVNAAACTLFGTTSARLTGVNWLTVLHSGDRERLVLLERDLAEGPQSRYQTNATAVTIDGALVTTRLTRVRQQRGADETLDVATFEQVEALASGNAARLSAASMIDDLDRQILTGVASGETNLAIASRVPCSTKTVEYRLRGLRDRFDVANTAALVARCYVEGVLRHDAWPPQPTAHALTIM